MSRQSNLNFLLFTYILSFLSLLLSQSGHSKYFGRFQKWAQRSLVYIDFTMIDEFDQSMQISECDILQDNNWMLAGRTL